jgi:CheY-like chemotaxis protein
MIIFLLEDNQSRVDTILNNWRSFTTVVHADSYYHALSKFDSSIAYDLIMLDHDLGGEIYVDISEDNTGTHFAKWMARNYRFKDVPIIIHSHNPVGAENMQEILIDGDFTNVTQLPFGTLVNLWNRGTLKFLGNYKYDEIHHT